MKKIKKLFGLTLLLATLFTGCSNPVYYYVVKDVPSLEGTVLGTIRSITRYTVGGNEYLVLVSADGIKYKSVNDETHGAWKDYTALPPFEKHHFDYYGSFNHVGEQMLVTHADADTLYLFTTTYENDDDEGTAAPTKISIYAKQITLAEDGSWSTDGEWTSLIPEDSEINYFPIYKKREYYYSAFSVFSTNAVQQAHRKVYLRSGDPDADDDSCKPVTYYELSGLNTPAAITAVPEDYADSEKDCINSAVYFDGDVRFYNSIAVTTNETADADATTLYYSFDKYIYYKKSGESAYTKSDFSTGQYASSLCVCKDALIIGRAQYNSTNNTTKGGVVKTSLDENGNIGTELTSFSTNIETQLRNSYFILCMLNVNPAEPELDSALYASIDFIGTGASSPVKFSEVGLWSYYPDRGNWNRE